MAFDKTGTLTTGNPAVVAVRPFADATEQEVMEALMNLMAGKTVIMVSHDANLIKKADNVVVLKNGTVEASGTYGDVLRSSPLLREFIEKGGAAA